MRCDEAYDKHEIHLTGVGGNYRGGVSPYKAAIHGRHFDGRAPGGVRCMLDS